MENMAAMVRAQGGIGLLNGVVIAGSRRSGSHFVHETLEAGSRQGGFGDEMVGDGDVGAETAEVCREVLGGCLKGVGGHRV